MDIDGIIAAWNHYLLGLYMSGQTVPLPPPAVEQWTNGMSQPDARGFVKLQEIEAQRASNHRWQNVCAWYAIKDILTTFPLNASQILTVTSNMAECAMIANSPISGDHPFDARELNTAYAMTPSNVPGVAFVRGFPYDYALSFPAGFTGIPDPTVADLTRFIATCNQTGQFPVIDHTSHGVVA